MKNAEKQCQSLLEDWKKAIEKLDIKISKREKVYANNSAEWNSSFWGKRYALKTIKMIDKVDELLIDCQAMTNNYDMFVNAFDLENQKEQN